MGTRHLIRITDKGGAVRVAQYGQWDGYPSGQGVDLLKEMDTHKIGTAEGQQTLHDALQKTVWIDDEARDTINACLKCDKKNLKDDFPALSRDTSAEIITVLIERRTDDIGFNKDGQLYLDDDRTFAQDSVMCEWVYDINLDEGVFTVRQDDGTPIIATFRLDQLPDKDSFVTMLEAMQEADAET